jgi:subtilisin-like proprotein convertase family protein
MRIAIYILLCVLSAFSISEAQTCSPPLVFTNTEISDTSVILRWFSLNKPDSGYQLDLQLQGLPPSSSPQSYTPDIDRDTLFNLSPQTAYTAYIRSICTNDTSRWKALDFYTAIRNGTSCNLDVDLRDNNCQFGLQEIPIYVKDHPGKLLGADIKLTDVELIIDHPYPADLQLYLRNPEGQGVALVKNHGTFTDHFGDPMDSFCLSSTRFSIDACQSIYMADPPFIGDYEADQSLHNLNDGSQANGQWKLEVCDRAADDVGRLKYVQLNFTSNLCPKAPTLSVGSLGDTVIPMTYDAIAADSLLVLYSIDSLEPTSERDTNYQYIMADPSDSLTILKELLPGKRYYYWTYIYCDGQWMGPSCRSTFKTTPGYIVHYSDWENALICSRSCDSPCVLSDPIWNSLEAGWQIGQGSTPTPLTGPEQDVFYNGQYLFKEASDLDCRQGNNVIQSICLSKLESDYHGISFFTHSKGPGVGEIVLRLSNDEWTHIDTLWTVEGPQGDNWVRHDIEFPVNTGSPFQLQILVSGSKDAFGDVAIGDIALMGVEAVPLSEQLVYEDMDMDEFGNSDIAVFYCGDQLPDTLSENASDCNDMNAAIYPTAKDTACNGVDEDCDGSDNFDGATDLQIILDSISPPLCPDSQDGWIRVSLSGGIPPYRSEWSNGDTSLYIDSLNGGIYTVFIEDSARCQSVSKTIELTPSSPIQFALQILQNATCPDQETGSAKVQLSGGTPPYSISWSNGETGDTAFTLPQGPFFVDVIDASNCQYRSDTLFLRQRNAFETNIILTKELSCVGSQDAALRVLAPNASPPLHFQWNTSDSTASLDQLSSGYYQVSVTDAQNCTVISDSFYIKEPDSLHIASLLVDPQRCAGNADASLSAQAKGGRSPYAYRWISPQGTVLTGREINQVLPGGYTLIVTDRNGCMLQVDSILIPSSEAIVLDTLEIKDTKCPLSKDGRIHIGISGGTSPYSIVWSDGAQNKRQREKLRAGPYGLSITDALSCKTSFNNIIVQKGDSSLAVKLELIDSIICRGQDKGAIEAEVNGGIPEFSYNWSIGIENKSMHFRDTLDQLKAGTYELTVTDEIGCVGQSNRIQLDSFAAITIDSIKLQDPSCHNAKNGLIEIFAKTNAPPLSYNWSTQANSSKLDSLEGGQYSVSINDQSNCRPKRLELQLENPDSLLVKLDTIQQSDSICILLDSIIGGVPPYTFSWLLNENTFNDDRICLENGSGFPLLYKIVDNNNCQIIELAFEGTSNTHDLLISGLSVYPNPFTDLLQIENSSARFLDLKIFNAQGIHIKNYRILPGDQGIYLGGLLNGLYLLQFRSPKGAKRTYKFIKN